MLFALSVCVVIQGLTAYCGQDLSGFYFDVVKDRLYTEPIGSRKRQTSQQVLLAIADSLCRVLQPLLPTMAQDVYGHYHQYLPEESGQLVGLLNWPVPGQADDSASLVQMHERLKGLRSEYLDFFHNQLKPGLGARSTFQVIVNLSESVSAAFEGLTREEWRQLFMAAHVEIGTGQPWEGSVGLGDWLAARLSKAEKCPRCWTFASQSAEVPCFRCLEQLSNQTELSHQM
jgi:isoleucyl-tRNA synthetase